MNNLIVTLLVFVNLQAFAQVTFHSVHELLEYVSNSSITLLSNDTRMIQAKKAKLAAIISVIDPTGISSLSFTDNTKLPTSLFPAEPFGGQAGTYKEVQTGVQYNTAYQKSIDIKLLNLAGWENLTLANLNVDLTNSNNQLSRKQLFENIAGMYYNIVNLQEQAKSTQENLAAADTLYRITQQRYHQGLVKQQDVNDSRASYLSTQESLRQLDFLTQQYTLSLKILCDIPDSVSIAIRDNLVANDLEEVPTIFDNNLSVTNSILKEESALSSYRHIRKSMLPVLSFTMSFSSQLYNKDFKIFGGTWYNSNALGLKLTIPMPSAATLSNLFTAKYNYELAKQQTEKVRIQSQLEYRQLGNDLTKAISQFQTNQEVLALREDSYRKNTNLYTEGLASIDQTLNSFNTLVNARLSFVSSRINMFLAKARIDINNTIR